MGFYTKGHDLLIRCATRRTIAVLPSLAMSLRDGPPIAWGLLGLDASITSLHCEVCAILLDLP